MAAPAKKKTNKDLVRVLTPEFRVSYPHVFKAQSPNPRDKAKYSITMLFPKSTDMGPIKKAILNAKLEHYGPKENWPVDEETGKSLIESPVTDGDHPKNADKEGYKGCWVIKATTSEDQRPGVVGPKKDPETGELEVLTEVSEFYPGCYARAYIFARRWEYMGKEGIHFILDHVQKMRDGKSFAGKKPADQVFSPIESDDAEEAAEEESF